MVAEEVERGGAKVEGHCHPEVVNLPQFFKDSVVLILSAAEEEIEKREGFCLVHAALEATFENRDQVRIAQHCIGEGANGVNLYPCAEELCLFGVCEHGLH